MKFPVVICASVPGFWKSRFRFVESVWWNHLNNSASAPAPGHAQLDKDHWEGGCGRVAALWIVEGTAWLEEQITRSVSLGLYPAPRAPSWPP